MNIRFVSTVVFAATLGLCPSAAVIAAVPSVSPVATHELQPTQMREDLERFRFSIEHAHAAPYRYATKAEFDERFAFVAHRIDHPMTDLDFYRLLAPVVARIRNSHTSISPPADAVRSIRSSGSVFPFILRYRDGRAFIERNLSSDARIRPGSEVLALDGQVIAEVTRDMMQSRSTEGFVDSGKFARLDQTFWFELMLLRGPAANYTVQVRDPQDGSVSDHKVVGVAADRLAAATSQFPAAAGPAQSMTIEPAADVAVMRIKNFIEPDTPAFFRKAFHDLALSGARNLIIDLRGNHGGIDWFNSDLLSYLCNHPFRFYRSRAYSARSYQDLKFLTYDLGDFLLPEQVAALPASVRERPFQNWSLPQLIDLTLATDHAGGVQVPKTQDRFTGNVYLLVDGMSGSSSAEVPALMHHLGLATIIGEEPNGSYQGEVAGIIPTLTLPNSKLNIRIPLIAYQNEVMAGVRDGRAAEPTFKVSETLEDSIAGVDTVMKFTMALIRARAPAITRAD